VHRLYHVSTSKAVGRVKGLIIYLGPMREVRVGVYDKSSNRLYDIQLQSSLPSSQMLTKGV